VPITILNGPLSVTASADLGDLGSNEGEPTLVPWQWYYHLPSFAGWALILLLLILLKENRNWQAWTILIPFILLTEILWPWVECVAFFREVGFSWHWLITVWTVMWISSPWLSRLRPIITIVLSMVIAAVFGVAAEFGVYGGWSLPCINLAFYGVGILALLSAFVLSGQRCRQKHHPRRFMVYLVPCLMIGTAAGFLIVFCATACVSSFPGLTFFGLFVFGLETLLFTAVWYLLNLPFMILAFRCPLYRWRLYKILRLEENNDGTMPEKVSQ
jgi:hypothetical protein